MSCTVYKPESDYCTPPTGTICKLISPTALFMGDVFVTTQSILVYLGYEEMDAGLNYVAWAYPERLEEFCKGKAAFRYRKHIFIFKESKIHNFDYPKAAETNKVPYTVTKPFKYVRSINQNFWKEVTEHKIIETVR